MEDSTREALWATFSMPGWVYIETQLDEMVREYEQNALNAYLSEEDRYQLGKLHGLMESISYLKNLEEDASPGYP